MPEAEQFVIDYLEGRVDSETFIERLKTDPSIKDWLQSIVPEGKLGHFETIYHDDGTWSQRTGPYDVRHMIDTVLDRRSNLAKQLNLFSAISGLWKEALPDRKINFDTSISDKFNFFLRACPDYLYSPTIEESGIFEKLLEELPKEWSKPKRIKEFKRRLKEMFFVEGQKYPRWAQESEWPLSPTGKPTKFLGQKSFCGGEVVKYRFLDMDTGKEIEVVQAY